MNSVIKAALLFLLAFMVSPAVADDKTEYRLAGTMHTGVGEWLAILELPGGEQRLLGSGDSIPGGEVVEIGATWLRLVDTEGELTLSLKGDGSHARRNVPDAMFVTVDASAPLTRSLEKLARSGSDPGQMTKDLRRLLQIPGDGEIAAIDHHPVESSEQGLELLLRSMGENHPVRIEVSGVEGFDAVYLTPLQAIVDTENQ